MLVKVYGKQVILLWSVVKSALKIELPLIYEDSPNRNVNILRSILEGKTTLWLLAEYTEDTTTIYGMIITRPVYDDFSSVTNLLVYMSVSLVRGKVPTELWVDAAETLLKVCRDRGYKSLMGYTRSSEFINLVKHMGGDVDTRLCVIQT